MQRLIHFGEDICQRVEVLKRAGYEIDVYISADQLRTGLMRRNDPDAILMTDHLGEISEEIVRLIRSCTSARIILFRSSNREYPKAWFDMVIPSLNQPIEWLNTIASTIDSSIEPQHVRLIA